MLVCDVRNYQQQLILIGECVHIVSKRTLFFQIIIYSNHTNVLRKMRVRMVTHEGNLREGEKQRFLPIPKHSKTRGF